jgi:hypothetical protein
MGYIPVIAVYLPNLSDMASRFNKFAILGSALFLGSVLMIGAHLFARFRRQIGPLFWSASVIFLLVGGTTEALIQKDHIQAWQEQKSIWRQLFAIAPSFRDHTTVLLVLPGRQDPGRYQSWRRTPLAADWDASSALRVLYGNPSLYAVVAFPDLSLPTEPGLTKEGIISTEIPSPVPYSQVQAFSYASGTLKKLDSLPPGLIEDSGPAAGLCVDCILDHALSVPLRRLVQ